MNALKTHSSGISFLKNHEELLILIAFWLMTLLLYAGTVHAGFVTDFTGVAMKLDHASLKSVLSIKGFRSINQIQYLQLYLMYKMFGTWGFPWYLLFCSLHAVNAWLLFKLFKRVFRALSIPDGFAISLLGAMLFMVIPYQAEVLTWRVCGHYLICTLFVLSALHATFSFLMKNSGKYVFYTHLSFVAALFVFELSFIIPALLFVFISSLSLSSKEISFKKGMLFIILPQFLLIGSYLILNQLILGNLVGHYGPETHLKFSVVAMSSTALQYLAKYTAFVHYLAYDDKQTIYSFFTKPNVVNLILIGGIFLVAAMFIFSRKISAGKKVPMMLLLMFFIALAPILNLYFMYILIGENDRYGYMASMFLYMFITYLLFQLPGKLKYLFYAAYFGLAIFYLVQTTGYWNQAAKTYHSLIDDFRWYDKEEVVVLTSADNYNGLYMFRCFGGCSGVNDALKVSGDNDYKGNMTSIVQFNMMTPYDSVNVRTDSNLIDISFAQGGNWFWNGGIGAQNFENDEYKFSIYEYSAVLEVKKPHPDRAFIYQAGDHWTEVPF